LIKISLVHVHGANTTRDQTIHHEVVVCVARAAARYYNWRQDGVSDLMLVTAASSSLLFTAALVKLFFIDGDHAAIDTSAVTAVSATAAVAISDSSSSSSSGGGLAPGSSSDPTSSLRSFVSALWDNIYTVMVLSFGENFPDAAESGPLEEVFDVLVALAGLAGFALALALVEQVVLETNLANVKRGSKVYEMGHVSRLRSADMMLCGIHIR